MAILVIDPGTQALIDASVAMARRKPLSWEDGQKVMVAGADHVPLSARKPGTTEIIHRSVAVDIPVGYRANISFEYQPVGLLRHLSISVEGRKKPGMMPSPEAADMIARAFGFTSFPPKDGRVWTEEFQPGEYAVNIVELDEP